MKTIGMAEIKQSVKQAVEDSQKEDVIITRHGRAVARLTRVESANVIDLVQPRKRRR